MSNKTISNITSNTHSPENTIISDYFCNFPINGRMNKCPVNGRLILIQKFAI
jgi:hypothetical protein